MRRGSQDLLSEIGSRPAYLEEFERKLAAALAQQSDARKARSGSSRSSHVDVEVPSSPSLDEAITPGSMGEEKPAKVELPSGKTRETRAQFSSAEPPRVSPPRDRTDDAAEALAAGGAIDVHAIQAAAPLSGQAETSSAGRAFRLRTEPKQSSDVRVGVSDKVTQAVANQAAPAVTHALQRGNGKGPAQEIGAAPGPVDSKAQQTIDVEALLAGVEAALANDADVEEVVKPATPHARPDAKVMKRL